MSLGAVRCREDGCDNFASLYESVPIELDDIQRLQGGWGRPGLARHPLEVRGAGQRGTTLEAAQASRANH